MFLKSASAATALFDSLLTVARRYSQGEPAPLLGIQTACRERGFSLPELDSFIRACQNPQPLLLLCGGDSSLAVELAAELGYDFTPTVDGIAFMEECADPDSMWRFAWVRHPERFQAREATPAQLELMLSQRAAVMLEDAPPPLRLTLEGLGQKLWIPSHGQLSIEAERRRLLDEVGTLNNDREEDLSLRRAAAWAWVASRLVQQIERRKQAAQQSAHQYELKQNSATHLLEQYRRNWTGAMRSLAESYLQTRISGPSFAHFHDAAKPGPIASTYLAALGLPAPKSLFGNGANGNCKRRCNA